ncbi:MAG: hypothetical protein GF333_02735 [Candidatus Omnitrophica bacterium]|nr:hypothetical protein [Candidatus Omnitrophota bacterium]
MKIARVILPIALEKEFDYCLSGNAPARRGMRVQVNFNGKRRIGIISGIQPTTKCAKIKPVLEVLDPSPVLRPDQFRLARALSQFYPYAFGEFLFMMLPAAAKRRKKLEWTPARRPGSGTSPQETVPSYIQGFDFAQRYRRYRPFLDEALSRGSVVFCVPHAGLLGEAAARLKEDYPERICPLHSRMTEKEQYASWHRSRSRSVLLGTRSALWYYPRDLTLIVLDEEHSEYYFQEEKPYSHLRDVARLVADETKCRVLLGGEYPSLATYAQIHRKRITADFSAHAFTPIQIIPLHDTGNKHRAFSPLLFEFIRQTLEQEKRCILIWNKKGYTRALVCTSCNVSLQCRQCSGYLWYSRAEDKAVCSRCERRYSVPPLCPVCNSGLLKSRGMGIEKLEAMIRQFFPEAALAMLDEENKRESDILLSTRKAVNIPQLRGKYDRAFILDIDSFLNRREYHATFDAFLFLRKLSWMMKERVYLFTRLLSHPLFETLNESWEQFYRKELDTRRRLSLPPYGHTVKFVLRGPKEMSVCRQAQNLYNKLSGIPGDLYGPAPEVPFRVRGNYRFSITLKTGASVPVRKEVKNVLSRHRTHAKIAVIIE